MTLGIASSVGKKPQELALYGGEDYELCFTMPSKFVSETITEIKKETGTKVTVIGKIIQKKKGKLLMSKNTPVPLASKGWDHFI